MASPVALVPADLCGPFRVQTRPLSPLPYAIRTPHGPDAHHKRIRCPPTSASPPPPPMHPAVSLVLENGAKYHQLLAPLLFTVFASIAHVHEPVQHSLLITAVSWAVIWLPSAFKAGLWSNTSSKRRKTGWLAGAFLALAHICDGAAADKEGTWTTKVFARCVLSYVS
jgi:hypothetical protein